MIRPSYVRHSEGSQKSKLEDGSENEDRPGGVEDKTTGSKGHDLRKIGKRIRGGTTTLTRKRKDSKTANGQVVR